MCLLFVFIWKGGSSATCPPSREGEVLHDQIIATCCVQIRIDVLLEMNTLFFFFLVKLPRVALCMLNVYLGLNRKAHTSPPFVPYEHLRLRSKVICYQFEKNKTTLITISNTQSVFFAAISMGRWPAFSFPQCACQSFAHVKSVAVQNW